MVQKDEINERIKDLIDDFPDYINSFCETKDYLSVRTKSPP